MQTKTLAQIEQEQIMEASGLGREDLEVLYEECADKLIEVETDLMDIAEDKITLRQTSSIESSARSTLSREPLLTCSMTP